MTLIFTLLSTMSTIRRPFCMGTYGKTMDGVFEIIILVSNMTKYNVLDQLCLFSFHYMHKLQGKYTVGFQNLQTSK